MNSYVVDGSGYGGDESFVWEGSYLFEDGGTYTVYVSSFEEIILNRIPSPVPSSANR